MLSQSSRNNAYTSSMGSLILAGMLTAAVSANAAAPTGALLDNFEGGSNQNKFLGYTYYYDDSKDGGVSTVASAKPGLLPGELLFDSTKSLGEGEGGSTKSLKLEFTFGATKPKCTPAPCEYGQMVGVGTELVPGTANGKVIDITSATSLSFMAKASVSMKLRVEVTTTNVKDHGYYRFEPTVGTTWGLVTFQLEAAALGGVIRPGWAETQNPGILFDKTVAQKLQIQVSADDNATLTGGTLLIDNIVLGGYTWVPPTACLPCVGPLTPKTGTLISDLEAVVAPPRAANQNTIGGYWYAYNDISARVNPPPGTFSEILSGAPIDTSTKKPGFVVTPAVGANASGGAQIKFALGNAFPENGETIQPFVGIGTKFSDQLGTVFFNATPSTGVTFDYMTDAPATGATNKVEYVTLEVKANQSVGTNTGAVHHILLPATNGVWMTATVPWDKLVLPDWTGVIAGTPLDITKLDQMQWAIKAAPTTSGGLTVDNVRFIGTVVGIVPRASKSVQGLRMSQVAGRMQVAYKLPAGVDAVEFSIVDMKGAVRDSRKVSGKGIAEASLNTQALRSGLYVMQVRHGEKVASQSFTLLK